MGGRRIGRTARHDLLLHMREVVSVPGAAAAVSQDSMVETLGWDKEMTLHTIACLYEDGLILPWGEGGTKGNYWSLSYRGIEALRFAYALGY